MQELEGWVKRKHLVSIFLTSPHEVPTSLIWKFYISSAEPLKSVAKLQRRESLNWRTISYRLRRNWGRWRGRVSLPAPPRNRRKRKPHHRQTKSGEIRQRKTLCPRVGQNLPASGRRHLPRHHPHLLRHQKHRPTDRCLRHLEGPVPALELPINQRKNKSKKK